MLFLSHTTCLDPRFLPLVLFFCVLEGAYASIVGCFWLSTQGAYTLTSVVRRFHQSCCEQNWSARIAPQKLSRLCTIKLSTSVLPRLLPRLVTPCRLLSVNSSARAPSTPGRASLPSSVRSSSICNATWIVVDSADSTTSTSAMRGTATWSGAYNMEVRRPHTK